METLERLQTSRKLTETRLLNFPDWFNKNDYEVHEYLQGGTLCRDKSLTIDYFECVSFVNHERCTIKNEWFIQAITRSNNVTKIITLKKK